MGHKTKAASSIESVTECKVLVGVSFTLVSWGNFFSNEGVSHTGP